MWVERKKQEKKRDCTSVTKKTLLFCSKFYKTNQLIIFRLEIFPNDIIKKRNQAKKWKEIVFTQEEWKSLFLVFHFGSFYLFVWVGLLESCDFVVGFTFFLTNTEVFSIELKKYILFALFWIELYLTSLNWKVDSNNPKLILGIIFKGKCGSKLRFVIRIPYGCCSTSLWTFFKRNKNLLKSKSSIFKYHSSVKYSYF